MCVLAMISQSENTAFPATWSRCQWLSSTVNRFTPRSSSAWRMARAWSTVDMRVVDQRVIAIDDRMAGDAERERAVVDPVGALGEAVAFDAPVIEREHVLRRGQDAQVLVT